MTDIVVDIRNVASQVHPDDRVYVWAPHLRERAGGGLTSTAPHEVTLVDGQATIENVDPGPVLIRFECMGISDTGDKQGTVPDDGPVSIFDVLKNDLTWTPEIVNDGLSQIEGARDEALGQVSGAVAAETASIRWVKGNIPVGGDLNVLTTPGIHGVTTYNHANGLVNRPPMGDAIRGASVEVKAHSNGSVLQTWIPWPLVGQRQLIVERLRDATGAWTPWTAVESYAQYLSVHEDIFAKPEGRWLAASYTVASQIVNRPPSDYGAWGPAIVDVDEGPSGQKMITWSTMNGASQVSSIWRTQQDNVKSWAPWRRIDGMTQEVVDRDERRVRDLQRSEFNRYRGILRVMLDSSPDRAPLWGFTGPTGDLLTYPTHEGSGHATHPSVLHFPDGWGGWEYWMAMTPYPDSDEGYEDPDIIVSHDGVTWQVPDGLTNPLDDQPGKPGPHNSDPHLVMHPDGRMILTWRMVDRPDGGRNRIFWRTSTDGVTWTPKREIWTAKDVGTRETSFLSQSMVWTGSVWRIYGVSGDFSPLRIRYYETADLEPTPSSWGSPIDCYVDPDLPPDREWWHLDVQLYQGQWWAIGNDHGRVRGFGDGTLYLLRSDDGQSWEASHTPLIATGGPYRDDLYKSSMVLSGVGEALEIDLFYSSYSSLADEWNIWRSACRLAGT